MGGLRGVGDGLMSVNHPKRCLLKERGRGRVTGWRGEDKVR